MGTHQPLVVFNELGIAEELQDKDFRDAFFRAEREIDIPLQIKSLRKLRGLNQQQLAEKANFKQSAISRLENAREANWELATLVRLAEALDARLSVVIEPFEVVARGYRHREIEDTNAAEYTVAIYEEAKPTTKAELLQTQDIDYGTYQDRTDKINLSHRPLSTFRSAVSA